MHKIQIYLNDGKIYDEFEVDQGFQLYVDGEKVGELICTCDDENETNGSHVGELQEEENRPTQDAEEIRAERLNKIDRRIDELAANQQGLIRKEAAAELKIHPDTMGFTQETEEGLSAYKCQEKAINKHVLRKPEKEKPKTNKRFRAKNKCSYFYNDSDGYWNQADELGRAIDRFRYNSLNYFQTSTECEEALNKIKALARVNAYIEEHDLRIPDGLSKSWSHYLYYVDYDHSASELRINLDREYNHGRLIGNLEPVLSCGLFIENCKDDLELLLKRN